MNRKIIEIDAEIARLRREMVETQTKIQSLAEARGRELATLEFDPSFRRKVSGVESGGVKNGAR